MNHDVSVKFKVDMGELQRAANIINNLKNTTVRINVGNIADVTNQLNNIKNTLGSLSNQTINIRFNGMNDFNNQINSVRNNLNSLNNSRLNVNNRVQGGQNIGDLRNYFGQNLVIRDLQRDLSNNTNPRFNEITNRMINNLNNSLPRIGSESRQTSSFLSQLSTGLGNLRSALMGLTVVKFAVDAIKTLASAIKNTLVSAVQTAFDYLSNKQMTTTELAILNGEGKGLLENGKLNLGNAKETSGFVSRVEEYARTSPMPTDAIMSGIRMGTAMGMKQDDAFNMTQRVGDVVGTGEQLYSVMRQLTQARGIGKVLSKDIYAMNDAAFPVVQMVENATGMTDDEFWDKVKDGAMDYNTVINAINKATSEGGIYFNASKIKAETFYGRMATLTDTVKIKLSKMFEGVFNSVSDKLPNIITAVENIFAKLSAIDLGLAFDNLSEAVYNAANMLLTASGAADIMDMSNKNLNDSFQNVIGSVARAIQIFAILASIIIAVGRTILNVITMIAKAVLIVITVLGTVIAIIGEVIAAAVHLIVQGVIDVGQWLKNNVQNFKNIGHNIGEGLAEGFLWGIDKMIDGLNWLSEKAASGLNILIDGINFVGEKTGLGSIGGKFQSNKIEKYNYKGNYKNVMWDSSSFKESQDVADFWSNQIGSTIDTASNAISTLADGIVEDGKDIANAWINVADAFSEQPDVLSELTQEKKQPKNAKSGDILPSDTSAGDKDKDGKGDKAKADGIKDITDAVKELSDALKTAIDKLFKFENAFKKLSIERFSPGKLIRRTTKFFNTFKEWTENLSKLSAMGVPDNVLYELRNMGLDGAGIVKGLLRSTNEQRSQILSNVNSSANLAIGQAALLVKHEHYGTITVKDNKGNVSNLNVVNTIANEVASNMNKYTR